MSGALLGAIAGLAALDAFNSATIVAVTLILLVAPSRPGLPAMVTILGAATTVFVAGAALFLGANAAARRRRHRAGASLCRRRGSGGRVAYRWRSTLPNPTSQTRRTAPVTSH